MKKGAAERKTMLVLVSLVLAIAFFAAAYVFLYPETACRAVVALNRIVLSPAGISVPCPGFGPLFRGGLDAKISSYNQVGGPFFACAAETMPFSAINSQAPLKEDGSLSAFDIDLYCDWRFSDGRILRDQCNVTQRWTTSGSTESLNLTLGIFEDNKRTGIEDTAKETVFTTVSCLREFEVFEGVPVETISAGEVNAFADIGALPVRSARIFVSNTTPGTQGFKMLVDGVEIVGVAGHIENELEITGIESAFANYQLNKCVGQATCEVPVTFRLTAGALKVDDVFIGLG